MTTVVFWVLAVASVGSGVLVFRVDSMARATFLLLASFLTAAGTLLLVDLSYLGVLIIIMMIMEMVVMVVFMIMYMMNPAGLMPMAMVHNTRGAIAIAASVFAGLAAGIVVAEWPERSGRPPADPTYQLGEAIMGPKMGVMMVIGIALLSTMIATVLLATRRGRYDRYGDELDRRRADDPVQGGVGR